MTAVARIKDHIVDSWNFASTPGMLPHPVRQRLSDEFAAPGHCVPLETYHWDHAFAGLQQELIQLLRQLCDLPGNCEILLLQGGASTQFFALPLNVGGAGKEAVYIETGYWSQKAAAAAASLGLKVSSYQLAEDMSLPLPPGIAAGTEYVFYVDNETADGIEFPCCPVADCDILVSDMSSNFMSRPFSFAGHSAIFAGAQKNLGIAGVTVVLLDNTRRWSVPGNFPEILDYSVQVRQGSLYNTPVLMSWYVMKLVLEWIEEQGGLAAHGGLVTGKSQGCCMTRLMPRLFTRQGCRLERGRE